MVTEVYFEHITETNHYRQCHKKEVPFGVVVSVVHTGKRKVYKNNIIAFKTDSYYVLGAIENLALKIINAKRIK